MKEEILNQEDHTIDNATPEKPITLFQTIKSVLWAMLGIQSKANLMRDFSRGKASNFIITGLILVILFVLLLVAIVKGVLHIAL